MRRKRILVDDKERVVHDREKSRAKTFDRAVRLLAAKPRAVEELRERLLEKTWTNAEIVDAVLERLKEYGYLNDEQYARDVALAKLRGRPQGRRRLELTMSQKKLDRETITTALASAYAQLPEQDLIDIAIEKRLRLKGAPKTHEDRKRLIDHLARRGFSYDLICSKIQDLRNAEDE